VQEDGKPLSGLMRDDFELLDEGKPREIAFFSAESAAAPAPAVTLPPNAYSNRMAATSGARNATVILFDGLNTEIRDQAYAKNQVIEFLEQIQPEDRVAIFVLGQELHVLHDFTSDSRSLLAALEQYKGRVSTELRASQSVAERERQSRIVVDPTQPGFPGTPGVADSPGPAGGGGGGAALLEQIFREFIAEANRRPSDFYTRQRGMWTARALFNIGHYLAAVPGRKNLIWVSSSLPFTVGLEQAFESGRMSREGFTFREEVEAAVRALNQGNVAIYPVDARGLAAPAAVDVQMHRFPVSGRGERMSSFSPAPQNLHIMHALSKKTGGKTFYGTNDIRTAVRTALEDAGAGYTLGFYPGDEPDGKFHRIRVRVKRKGADTRHREGYVALADRPSGEQQRAEEIRYLLHGPVDATAIGLDVRKELTEPSPESRVKLTIRVGLGGITLDRQGDRWKGKLEVVVAQNNVEGKTLHVESQNVDLNLTESDYQKIARSGGMLLWKTVTPEPEIAEFRVVVVDHPRTLMGSLRLPHTVTPREVGAASKAIVSP